MTDNKFNMDGFYAVPKAEWDHQTDTIAALRREKAALEARVGELEEKLNSLKRNPLWPFMEYAEQEIDQPPTAQEGGE